MIKPGHHPARALAVLATIDEPVDEQRVWAEARKMFPGQVSERANFNEPLNTLRLHSYATRLGRRGDGYRWEITYLGRNALEETS